MYLADEICNKTICNKCQTYSFSITTLSFKMRFSFFQYNNETLKHRDSESFCGSNMPKSFRHIATTKAF